MTWKTVFPASRTGVAASRSGLGIFWQTVPAQYQDRFPAARIAVVQTPAVMEDQSCLFYPATTANAS